VLTLLWSAVLLGEQVDGLTVVAALGVLACVVLTQRTREHGQAPVGRHG
jgi:drug/metabolite transporter (DMT)-like permease